jgi:hypothetical protein
VNVPDLNKVAVVDVVETCEPPTTAPAVMSYNAAYAAYEDELVQMEHSKANLCAGDQLAFRV